MEESYVSFMGGEVRVEVEESVAAQLGQIALAFALLVAVSVSRWFLGY